MGIVNKIKSFDFIRRLITRDYDTMGTNAYYTDKPKSSIESHSESVLVKGSVNDVGWSYARLYNFYEELTEIEGANPHSLTLVQNNKIISQLSIAPYDVSLRHETHSECKTIVGLAVGIAIDEGILTLNTTIGNIFPEHFSLLRSRRIKDVTVSQLLRMTSGASFREADVISNSNWVSTFIESGVKFTPGTNFQYNSMNTYMLCAMICRLTSGTLVEYLSPRLFEPLHIYNVLWEKCPRGIEKGGWGCYLSTEEFVRIGTVILNNGRFTLNEIDTPIVSESWIKEMLTPTPFPTYRPDEMYGCQIWLRKEGFMFNGMFGQYLLAYPKYNTLVGLNSGGDTTFSLNSVTELIDKYFGNNQLISQNADEDSSVGTSELDQLILKLSGKQVVEKKETINLKQRILNWFRPIQVEINPYEEYYLKIINQNYEIELPSASFSPIILLAMHNAWESGPKLIHFSFENNSLTLNFIQKSTADTSKIPIGLDTYEEMTWMIRDNAFTVKTKGRFGTNEDGQVVLTVMLYFIETSSVRCVKFVFNQSKVDIKLSEMPSMSKLMSGYIEGASLPSSIFGTSQSQQTLFTLFMYLISEPEITGTLVEPTDSVK